MEQTIKHPLIAKLQTLAVTYGLDLLGAIIILLIGWTLANFFRKVVKRLLAHTHIEKTIILFIGNGTHGLTLLITIIAVLNKLGVQTGSLIAVLGAIGLAVSLAFKNSLGNLASGILIVIYKPFKIDDYIEVGGKSGTVEDINIFSTKLVTPGNETIYIPNGTITNTYVTNYSQHYTRRLEIIVGVGYDDDLQKVRDTINQEITQDTRILRSPEPFVGVIALANSSVNFTVRIWLKKEDYWPVFFDMQEKLKLAFDKADINIPYPQTDVHLYAENK